MKAVKRIRIAAHVPAGVLETVFSVLFAALIMLHGIPSLRQDWAWPSTPDQVQRFVIDTWSGWDSSGIGAPAPYPSSYLLAIPVYVLLLLTGPTIGLFLFLVGIGLCVTLSARRLVDYFQGGISASGIVAFALFNPWVYTKVVAGHIIMVLAYGGTLMLSYLLIRDRPHWARVGASLLLIFGQLQFFIIAMALLATQLSRRAARRAWACGAVLFLPTIIGVIAGWRELRQTPYMLVWQQSQSVKLTDAALLVGYFTGYADAIEPLARIASGCALLAAGIAIYYALRETQQRRTLLAAVVGVGGVALIFASGTRGPIAPFYEYLVRTVPASGLFRELYDLIAYVALAYVILSAYGSRRPQVALLSALAGSLAIASWCFSPPAHFFVPRGSIPSVVFHAPTNTRYALYPAVQPMSYHGRGLGADPDAYSRGRGVTAVNTYMFEYPSSVALLLRRNDASNPMLGELSVATVLGRPWLQSDFENLKDQMGSARRPQRSIEAGIQEIAYMPEMGLTDPPRSAGVSTKLDRSSVFFQDAKAAGLKDSANLPTFEPFPAPNNSIDATTAWVDARLTFLSHLHAAQGFGGIATSSTVPLQVPLHRALLVYVRGELKARGLNVASNTGRYRWVAPISSDPIRCFGYCVIAGMATAIPRLPDDAGHGSLEAVPFKATFPWLIKATLPAEPRTRTLRYNVRYDRAWVAFANRSQLKHVRLDHLFNAWMVPPHRAPMRLMMVEIVAAGQTLCEVVGLVLAIVLVALALRPSGGVS